MLRLTILFLSLFTLSFAEPIVKINSDVSNIENFELSYFISDNSAFNFEDIVSKQFVKGANKDSLGAQVTDVWIKIKLLNNTAKTQRLFLHQDQAYTFISLEYFETDEKNNILNRQTIAPFDQKAEKQLHGSDAVYEFLLKPKEIKTIYVHQKSPAYHFYNFLILSKKESMQYLIYEKVIGVLLVGLLMALSFYNLLIYFSSRYKEYLYYSLYLTSSTLWIFYIYGSMAHYLHIYGEIAFRFNYGLMLGPVFLALFVQAIFQTKQIYKKEHLVLNSIIVVLSLNAIYGLVNFESALQALSLILNYSSIAFLGVAISIYLKGSKIIKIFLFAHIFYLIFNVYALLFYLGIVDFTYLSSHGIGIGITIEALMFSYLVSYKFKVMEKEIKEDRLKQVELKLLSVTDYMTKLYNRRYFEEVSETILDLAKRHNSVTSAIVLDIDDFKSVNDTYGHKVGDDVIISLAKVLQSRCRKSDIVCRWGGEEFVILFPKTDLDRAVEISEKIRSSIESIIIKTQKNQKLNFTVSIGVSQVDNNKDNNIQTVIQRADKALYKAKKSGKNKVCKIETVQNFLSETDSH